MYLRSTKKDQLQLDVSTVIFRATNAINLNMIKKKFK